jgi:hypothetical protein
VRLFGVGFNPELSAFCREEWPRLAGALALYTGDRDLVEELVQEALLRVVQRWAQLADVESRLAWAHRVRFNLAKSGISAPPGAASSERAPPRGGGVRARFGGAGSGSCSSRAPGQALTLRYFADLSVREVAAIVGCPENTVKTNTRPAIEALRTTDLGEGGGEDWCTSGGQHERRVSRPAPAGRTTGPADPRRRRAGPKGTSSPLVPPGRVVHRRVGDRRVSRHRSGAPGASLIKRKRLVRQTEPASNRPSASRRQLAADHRRDRRQQTEQVDGMIDA